MSNTVRMCQITSCKKEAATLCYHCEQAVCHTHFAQHSSMLMADVHSLADRINTLTDHINTFSTVQMRKNLFNQLQQWRDENIAFIKHIYKQKQRELNEKIGQFDTILNVMQVEKQQEISLVKKNITETIDVGEATFDQVNRLRKAVDKITADVDKLITPSIRIETQPVNRDACRIICMDQIPSMIEKDVSVYVSKIHISNDDKHSKKSTNRSRSSKKSTMITTKNNTAASSDSISNVLMTPPIRYLPRLSPAPMLMQPPISQLPPMLPSPPPKLPPPPPMLMQRPISQPPPILSSPPPKLPPPPPKLPPPPYMLPFSPILSLPSMPSSPPALSPSPYSMHRPRIDVGMPPSPPVLYPSPYFMYRPRIEADMPPSPPVLSSSPYSMYGPRIDADIPPYFVS